MKSKATKDQKLSAASEKKAGIGKTFGIVAILTVFSKVIGLARDIVVTSAYGTTIVADAYNYAYMVTGNILILFGGLGGPFHSTTVAVLTSRKDEETAGALMLQILLATFVVLSAIAGIMYLCSEPLAGFMATQYKPSAATLNKLNLTVEAAKLMFAHQVQEQLVIMLPLVVIAGVIGIAYGISNVYNKLFWPSFSPAIASVAIIIAVIFFSHPESRLLTGVPLAVGTLAGAIGQLLAQVPSTCTSGLKWSFSSQAQPGLHEYRSMLWPAVFSTSVGQLIVYVDSYFTLAYLGEGSWTAVLNSNRLVQLPLGVLLTAMLVPILPRFTQQVTEERIDDLKEEFRRALRFLWFLALPLSAILIAIPKPIISVLFQRGNFDQASTDLVATALLWLVPSIFFYVGRDLITRVFYAFKDSKTPYHVALIAIVVKAALDWTFVTQLKLDVAGISLASSLITVINLSLLTIFLRAKIGRLGLSKLIAPVTIMLVAATASAFATLFSEAHVFIVTIDWLGSNAILDLPDWLRRLLSESPQQREQIARLASVAVSSTAGMSVFAAICIALRLEEPSMLLKRILKKKAA